MEDKPDHSNRGHAEFSPSSLKYVAGCSGYEGRSGTNAAAEKGTRIHEALEIKDPSALHDEEEVNIYEAIVADEEAYLSSFANGETYKEYTKAIYHAKGSHLVPAFHEGLLCGVHED